MRSHELSRRHLLAAATVIAGQGPQRASAQTLGNNVQPGIRSIFEWIPTEAHDRIGQATEERDLAPFIQKAFDEMPVGSTLYFPTGDYRLHAGLHLSRQINLVGDHARLVGFFGNRRDTLLEIGLTSAANANGDARLMKIEGMVFYFATGGGDAVSIHARDAAHDGADTNEMPNLLMLIERCAFAAPSIGKGVALRIEGYLTQAHTIRNCDITNTLHLRCVDAVQIHGNLIQGDKVGVVVDVYRGAYKTEIARNVIVCRDGAVIIKNGSQVDIQHNQIEQPPTRNMGSRSAHIVIEPQAYDSHSCTIAANNFGGGTNLARSIYLNGSKAKILDTRIENNIFGISREDGLGADVELADPGVAWTQIANNAARGARATADPGIPIRIADSGTGTSGVRRDWKSIALSNGWTAGPGFAFWTSPAGILYFEGSLRAGQRVFGTLIGTLPPGCRPRSVERILVATDTGFATLGISPRGELTWQGGGSTDVYLSGVALSILSRDEYSPGG